MVDLTGKQDAIAIKEEYQKALDYAHEKVKRNVKHLYEMNHKLKYAKADAKKFKDNMVADEEEKNKLYESLGNLLNKETNFEKEMMGLSQKGKKATTIKVKNKDVDDVNVAMREYLDKYPEYASKSSFKRILDRISEIEQGIKNTKKQYNEQVSIILRELEYFPRVIMEAEDKISVFRKQLKEGNEKLSKMRYLRSVFYKLSSEKEKMKVNIHTLYYRIDEFEKTIEQLKKEVEETKGEYKKI
jgi:DNA repair ATPase RecN